MPQSVNSSNMIKRFSEMMQGGPVILYIGSDFNIEDYPVLLSMPWSCIYTSDRRIGLAQAFHTKNRQVRVITTYHEYKSESIRLSKSNPPLIYISGNELETEIDPTDIDSEQDFKENQRNLIGTISKTMESSFASLVIVGYSILNPMDLKAEQLYSVMRLMSHRSVYFFGVDDSTAADRYIARLEENQIASIYIENLGQLLQDNQIIVNLELDEDDIPYMPKGTDELGNTVFIGGKPCEIDSSLRFEFSKFGRLLTVKEMTTGPVNRMMMVEKFYRFLKNSPKEPQWEGYDPKFGFNMKRAFEEDLYTMIDKALKDKREMEKPMILSGQTSSGKTIALANLAYRVFHEKQYPVVYLINPDLKFSADSPELIALDNLMQELEHRGADHVLIIWDCSVYNCQKNDCIRRLFVSCSNRGRKPIIVASAMLQNSESERRLKDEYQIQKADINLNPDERKRLKNLIIEKGKLPSNQVEYWMQKNTDGNLLSLLYTLVYWLHPQLEQGVNVEINKGVNTTKDELRNEKPPEQTKIMLSSMRLAAIKAGLINNPNEYEPAENRATFIEKLEANLEFFCHSLAVCSQFKLKMPLVLAMRLLDVPATSNNARYREIIFNAPWLVCVMDDDEYSNGEYYVSFRTPTEAKIYLASNHTDEMTQMQIVAGIIDKLGDSSNPFYTKEVTFVESLIRMIGPNSDDVSVQANRNSYIKGCPTIIDSLIRLRENGIVELLLVSQEITYIREFYGKELHPVDVRIEWLERAVATARNVIDDTKRHELNTPILDGIINSITVESIFSEICLEKAYDEKGIACNKRPLISTYVDRYDRLIKVITTDQSNSYAYTALLNCFKMSYYDEQLSFDIKLKYLSQMLEIIEEVTASIPTVEENSEYQREKQQFNIIFDNVTGSNKAEKYFQKLLDMGSASGIHLKAHSILKKGGISFNEPLVPSAKIFCAEAISLLENPEYDNIVGINSACQYMLLRLKWLYFNTYPIFSGGEQQLTTMSLEQWRDIWLICTAFSARILKYNPDIFYATTIYYLLALANAQLGDFDAAEDAQRCIKENSFGNTGRNWVWHIICEETGDPRQFSGTLDKRFYDTIKHSGHIYVPAIHKSIYFRNLASLGKAEASGTVDDLCIGTSYIGFTAFSKKALKRRGIKDGRE